MYLTYNYNIGCKHPFNLVYYFNFILIKTMNNYNTLSDMINLLEESYSKYKNKKKFKLDINTSIDDKELSVLRNLVITNLRSTFITSTGYINLPALLMFCHNYDYEYSNIDTSKQHNGFTLTAGGMTLNIN